MTIAVCVDDVLFFGPSEANMEDVINEFESDGFELKREKSGDDTSYDFLGINISKENGMIKMTQHGLKSKFLKRINLENCNSKTTPAAVTPLGTDLHGA